MLDFIRNPEGSIVAGEAAAKDELERLVPEAAEDSIVYERFQYDPYGMHSTAGESGVNDACVAEGYDWLVGFQGGMVDPTTEMVPFEVRDCDPAIGRWIEQDPLPLAYIEGANLYQFEDGNPESELDPIGIRR